ncbi:MAG: CBS domain-containing protein [Deltaproteobacteria bacterium]|nr:CBS domain-containing protein [Deltaproteobacteria bacterium]
MLKAKDIMSQNPVTVSMETEVGQVAKLLFDKHINGVPVVDAKGKLKGILCQSDLIAQQKKLSLPSVFTLLDSFIPLKSMKVFEKEVKKMAAATAGDAMTPNPYTVGLEATIEDVATLMVEKNFHTIPVVESGRLVGIIGKEDVLRTLTRGTDE